MGRGPSKKGEEARQRILAELARRYAEFELPPTWDALASETGMPLATMRYHVARLQARGLINPAGLWITRAGFEEIGGILGQ